MPYRVLFVDDDPDTRDVIEMCLKVNGFEVRSTISSSEALRIAREERFDAYLFDNWMPEMTGIELCLAVRQFDASSPIIFYSGAAREVNREEALSAGASYYLAKPVDLDQLVDTLSSLLER